MRKKRKLSFSQFQGSQTREGILNMECLARIQKSNSDAAVSTDAMTPLEGETLDKIMKTLFGQEVN